jgi:glycosyltransferase involved in cell wall biosynthesis
LVSPFLSVVIPAYNEEQRIAHTLEVVIRFLKTQGYSWEIIVVDDGSEDKTATLVRQVAQDNIGITLVGLPHKGKGSAVKEGMLQASGQYRFLADADLSMPIEQLQRFLPPALDNFDIAIGSREILGSKRFHEPSKRHIMGRVFNLLVRFLAIKEISDTQCGFKCFEANVAETLFPFQRAHGWGFDVEILFLAQKVGMNIHEIPIDWYYRQGSKIRPWRDSFLMFRDLLFVRWNYATGKYRSLLHK